MYGLTNSDLEVIVNTIKNFPEVEEAIIFGSRALNTFKKGSDIDIALKGKEIGIITATISGILNDESPLPYFCDVLDYDHIDNEDLRDHIDRVGCLIYKKLE